MRSRHHVLHVCRRCHGRFAGFDAWNDHHLLRRTRCALPRWLQAVCDRGLRVGARI